jgi:hypothetical protein
MLPGGGQEKGELLLGKPRQTISLERQVRSSPTSTLIWFCPSLQVDNQHKNNKAKTPITVM